MRWYLDASVALHAILPGGDARARRWLDATLAEGGEVFSSTLLHLELTRVLRRENLSPSLARPLLERVHQVSIDDGILRLRRPSSRTSSHWTPSIWQRARCWAAG